MAAKRVLRYLAGTVRMGLVYTSTDLPLLGYSNADWGGDLVGRKSYSGYAFLMSGAAVTWKSQKQRSVALSSTEAEYVSLSEAVKEALHLRSLLMEIKLDELADLTICIDNRGAQYLANDPMVADVLTKALPRVSHERCTRDLGLEMIEDNPST
ncbi:uncharacterized protein [Temnothorax longispinosus]|uniref:uncharacterized protein n=1 Tax=Temnothorax longispinosus TaxID=300112 RepID=UPI003A98EC61